MDTLSSSTRRGLRHFGVALIACVAMWGICAWSNTMTITVTPTPRFTPTFLHSYTATLTSPNGSITVLRECISSGLQELCVWHLSHDNVIPNVSRIYWSADNHYAVICHHTEECLQGLVVWNMTSGTRLKLRMEGNNPLHKWHPTDNLLAYYPVGAPGSYKEPRRLTIFDPQTGEISFPGKCPDWVLLPTANGGDNFEESWKQLCAEVIEPAPTSTGGQ
jgi:hypothetical protein